MRDASAESQEMDALFNNNPPRPTNDVMVNPVNPVNPDSNQWRCAYIFQRRLAITQS
ncbi:MAG: hypothetical protein NWS66_00820 [Saprospiraceae bacterium]|nr:hypothetical protein [Saprospiraceae bacterium]MDP4698457.1 hypothetical protein [Saprospiraceae bacterium]MDP4815991.1 hypothetical protein [Saprospiraceae bacterium]MDP4914245.1 hypothetical protein [Saprospiraceae bacterium]MDP5047299.1 hypothetical protein [Saprospiraceae bacterium]